MNRRGLTVSELKSSTKPKSIVSTKSQPLIAAKDKLTVKESSRAEEKSKQFESSSPVSRLKLSTYSV